MKRTKSKLPSLDEIKRSQYLQLSLPIPQEIIGHNARVLLLDSHPDAGKTGRISGRCYLNNGSLLVFDVKLRGKNAIAYYNQVVQIKSR